MLVFSLSAYFVWTNYDGENYFEEWPSSLDNLSSLLFLLPLLNTGRQVLFPGLFGGDVRRVISPRFELELLNSVDEKDLIVFKTILKSGVKGERKGEKNGGFERTWRNILHGTPNSDAVVDEEESGRAFLLRLESERVGITDNVRFTEFSECINVLKKLITPKDEVIVLLTSSGGPVDQYGLASSQLLSLKEYTQNITVCVDKLAASGGYMIACVASKILAAPFSRIGSPNPKPKLNPNISPNPNSFPTPYPNPNTNLNIGSVGVLQPVLNVHKALEKLGIDGRVLTSGIDKAPLTAIGKIDSNGLKKQSLLLNEVKIRSSG